MIFTALIEGLLWSALWTIYVYIIVKCFPWQMLHDYPKDIQEAATLKEPTDRQSSISKISGILGSLVIFGSLILFGIILILLQF